MHGRLTQHNHHREEQDSKVGVGDVQKVIPPEHILHQPQPNAVPVRRKTEQPLCTMQFVGSKLASFPGAQ